MSNTREGGHDAVAGGGEGGPAPDREGDRLAGFEPALFRRRRDAVLDALADGTMVLPAAPVVHRSRDATYPYRPDSELFYLTGLVEPGAAALLRGHADEERFVLFVRDRDEKAERWTGPRPGPEKAAERYGADAAHPMSELEERFPGLVEGARSLHVRLSREGGRIQDLALRALERARRKGPRAGAGPRAVVDPGQILDPLRLVKDEAELERIRRAADATVAGFRAAAGVVEPGVEEWRIALTLEEAFRAAGAGGTGFNTIVGSGPRACTIHYEANDARLPAESQVLIDAGAEVDRYHGDVSRTFPTSGSFTAPARDVYRLVEEARRTAVEVVAPGATVADVHEAALHVLVDGMLELGILEGERDEVLEEEAYKPFYPHRTSHWLGLDVHDPGDYARGGESRVLEPGMVLTVEPGLYVPEGAGAGAAAFAGVGVRIEDDVLVTGSGHEVLTAGLPTGVDEVEAMVG